jgi:hypothetical protein
VRRSSSRPAQDAEDPLVLDAERWCLGPQVDLVEDDDLRSLVQAGAVRGELGIDRTPALVRLVLGRVDDVHEQPRALEVSEELVAEPDALASALDQTGHVGDNELAPVRGLHRPEHRGERRERVLGDLRTGVRDSRQERRLARVRETHERGVGEELEAELDLPLLAGQADLGEARRLPAWTREVLVATPAGAALRHDDSRAHLGEVGGELLALEDLRPDGNREHCVVSVRAVRATAAARSTATRTQFLVRPHAREVAPP